MTTSLLGARRVLVNRGTADVGPELAVIKLEGRYDALVASWPEAPAEKAKVTATRDRYEKALVARKDGTDKSAAARAAHHLVREDFRDVFASVASRVKAEFPRDRKTQDLFFDAIASRRSGAAAADDADDAEDGEDEPTN